MLLTSSRASASEMKRVEGASPGVPVTEGLGAVGMAMTMEVRAKAAAANEMATILAIG